MTCCRELTFSHTCLVEWAVVASSSDVSLHVDWLEMDGWEGNDWLLVVAVFNTCLAGVPFGTLEEDTVAVDTVLWCLLDSCFEVRQNIGLEDQGINRSSSLSGVSLESSCHETLWEEECRYPVC
jgi:hypothetical protein